MTTDTAYPEWRCPKCGAQADERYDCCEVYADTAHPEGEGELLPCPFCGGAAPKYVDVTSIRDGKQVWCSKCRCSGPSIFHGPGGWPQCTTDAITAWNTRPTPPSRPQGEEGQALVAEFLRGPCPICGGIEGCDHSVTERLRAALSNQGKPSS